jgi:hypothetical protein
MRVIDLSTFQFYYDVILGIINEHSTADDLRSITYSVVFDKLTFIYQFLKLNDSLVIENPKLLDTLQKISILSNSFKQEEDGVIKLCRSPRVTIKLIMRCLCADLQAYSLQEEQTLIGCDTLASELYHILFLS